MKLKTHCVNGHERTPENVNPWGSCKDCMRLRTQERRRDKVMYVGSKCDRCKFLAEYVTVLNGRIVSAQAEMLVIQEMLRQKLVESAAHDEEHERRSKAQTRRRAA